MIHKKRKVAIMALCLTFLGNAYGQSQFGANNYAEYIPGDAPIILVAPHGGELKPDDIPDRSCSGCVYSNDLNTQELGRAVQQAIYETIGCTPHLVINRLHRIKMDANRAIGEAADGDPAAEQAWREFHGFIAQARRSVDSTYGKGMLIDLHGHGHSIQRLEIGYLLSKSDLQLSDEAMDASSLLPQKFSMRSLLESTDTITLSTLIRGENSLGAQMEALGFPAVPGIYYPYPEDNEPYFTGGYNTSVYGSAGSGNIDALQIECNLQGVRDNAYNRDRFAKALAATLDQFIKTYYPELEVTCDATVSSNNEMIQSPEITIAPNPGGRQFQVISHIKDANWQKIRVIDLSGRQITFRVMSPVGQFPVQLHLPEAGSGLYIIQVIGEKQNTNLTYLLQQSY